jgi:hypothetical protein
MLTELQRLAILLGGAALAVIAWIWLLRRAFHERTLWGLAVLVFPPAALFFFRARWKAARAPVFLLLFAGVVALVPIGLTLYERFFPDLGPREKIVDGELHITLTGWDRDDYAILESRPNVVVLQMANEDVTDDTLRHLRGSKLLRELDLNDTQITDEGLAVLAGLPALRSLRLRKTAITDAGFRQHLLGKETLRELDLTGTRVASKTVREWKKGHADRKALK